MNVTTAIKTIETKLAEMKNMFTAEQIAADYNLDGFVTGAENTIANLKTNGHLINNADITDSDTDSEDLYDAGIITVDAYENSYDLIDGVIQNIVRAMRIA